MSWHLLALYAGLVAASLSVATYGFWSARWARHGERLLAVMNALVALVGALVIVAHLWSLTTPELTAIRLRRVSPFLTYLDALLLLPVVTRLLELRSERRREALRTEIVGGVLAATRSDPDVSRPPRRGVERRRAPR